MDTNQLIAAIVIAVIGGVPSVLAWLQSRTNTKKAEEAARNAAEASVKLDSAAAKLDENTELTRAGNQKTDAVAEKTEEVAQAVGAVHDIANGNTAALRASLDAAVAELAAAHARIHELGMALAGQERHASLTDAAVAKIEERLARHKARNEASARETRALAEQARAEVEQLKAAAPAPAGPNPGA